MYPYSINPFAKGEDGMSQVDMWALDAALEQMMDEQDFEAAAEAYYGSEEFQAKQEADIQCQIEDLRQEQEADLERIVRAEQGPMTCGDMALAMDEKAAELGYTAYLEDF